MNISLVILKDALNDAFDKLWIAFAIHSDNVVDLGNVKKPVVVDKLLVEMQWKVVFVVLHGLAYAVEDFQHAG